MLKLSKRKAIRQLNLIQIMGRKKVNGYKGKQEFALYALALGSLIVLIGTGLKTEVSEYHPLKPVSPKITPVSKTVSSSIGVPTLLTPAAGLTKQTALTSAPTPTLSFSPTHSVTSAPTSKPASHAVVQSESASNPENPTPTTDQTISIFSSPTPAGQSAQPCLVSLNGKCIIIGKPSLF